MLKRNLIANYLGQGWSALMGVAFIPIYVKYLGIEAYGLVGLYAVLQAWLGLLDMGMSPTLSREMARFTAGTHSAASIRDLLRSIELIALGVAVLVALGIWAASGWMASDWLRAEKLPVETVAQSFGIMGAVTALRFIEGIYRSALLGLQRQVICNLVTSAFATLRAAGAVWVLAHLVPTIEAFFVWQGLVSLLTLVTLARITYQYLPAAGIPAKFSIPAVRGIAKFAGGMMGITFLALLLTQVDKILLSRLLSLSDYGYYTLASMVAGAPYLLTAPIAQAWFPRLTELYATNNQPDLIRKFHQGAQLVSVTMGSAALVLMIFAEPLLQIWTQDRELARRSAPLLSILALGTLLNGLMWVPYQTQLAHGWTRLAFRINVVAVLFIIPAILWATPRYGPVGAAWAWVTLNAGYVLIGIHFMYRKILTGEKWRWYREDLLQPLVAAGLITGISAWLMPSALPQTVQLLAILFVSTASVLAAAWAAPAVRDSLLATIKNKLKSFDTV